MSSQHSFNVEIATVYGVDAAAVLNNLYFWVNLNRANGEHFYEGRYWTYNTQENFLKLFPYLKNRDKVKRVVSALEKAGLILKGNFNKKNYDRTTWYALTDKAFAYYETVTTPPEKPVVVDWADMPNGDEANDSTIGQKCPKDRAEMPNAMGRNAQPIPDINQMETTDTNKTLGGDSKKPDPIERDFEQLWQIKPDRGGNNPKRTALSAYRARRKEGHTHDEITAGLIRYTQQCAAYGRLGTEYVKQMATFLSKNLFFKDPWEIKPDAASRTDHKKPNAADKLRSDFERKWGDRADDIQTVS